MVKKRLLSGDACKKCEQAEELLKRRNLWPLIDEVVWADERDESSAGMVLAKEHHVDLAPFFLIDSEKGREVVTSVVLLAKEHLEPFASAQEIATSELTEAEVSEARARLTDAKPEAIVDFALGRLGASLTFAFSGAEDVVLLDMAAKSGHKFSVFCLDTGRLHPETYRYLERVRTHYGLVIDVVNPEHVRLAELVRKKGLFSFYDDGHTECCTVRKVEPLRRWLANYAGWATGQRRDQSPTRADVPELVWDKSHKPGGMLKVNPLARVTQAEVWEYIRRNDVPYNELHDRGFVSIGCEPCTRPSRPGEHERAGRWWWEEATQRECGLHKG